jgi:hypothetical protein
MPPRIGDILVREGLVTIGDVQEALALVRRQPMRLASALVELGRLSSDDASRALAQQHGVPAALAKHLSGRDLALAELVPATLARSLGALPLAVQRNEGALVVCVRDPGPAAIAALEKASGRSVMVAVAVEVALLPLIDETYPHRTEQSEPGIPVEFDVDIDTGPVASEDTLDVGSFQLVDLDHQAVSKDPSQSSPGMRMPGFFPVGTEPAGAAPRQQRTTNTMQAQRSTGPMAALELPRTLQLDPAIEAIRAADTRDEVVDALIAFLRHRFHAAVVFSVKEGLALGQAGFGSDTIGDAVQSLAIPLAQPSVLRLAHDRKATFVGPPGEASVVQERFFKLFGSVPSRVVVVPIAINARILNLLYAHGPRLATPEEAAAELGTVAAAAEAAFVRIIRESKG